MFDFAGHKFSAATTQLCHCSMKAAIDNTKTNGLRYVLVKLYSFTKKGTGLDLA